MWILFDLGDELVGKSVSAVVQEAGPESAEAASAEAKDILPEAIVSAEAAALVGEPEAAAGQSAETASEQRPDSEVNEAESPGGGHDSAAGGETTVVAAAVPEATSEELPVSVPEPSSPAAKDAATMLSDAPVGSSSADEEKQAGDVHTEEAGPEEGDKVELEAAGTEKGAEAEAAATGEGAEFEAAGTEKGAEVETAGTDESAEVEAAGTEESTEVESVHSDEVAEVEAAGTGEGAEVEAAVLENGAEVEEKAGVDLPAGETSNNTAGPTDELRTPPVALTSTAAAENSDPATQLAATDGTDDLLTTEANTAVNDSTTAPTTGQTDDTTDNTTVPMDQQTPTDPMLSNKNFPILKSESTDSALEATEDALEGMANNSRRGRLEDANEDQPSEVADSRNGTPAKRSVKLLAEDCNSEEKEPKAKELISDLPQHTNGHKEISIQ